MRVRVIGSGTLLPHPARGAPGHWVEVERARVLLDCGSGTLRGLARFGLSWEETTHVFLSHFHTDHVGDVAPLLFALKHGPAPPRRTPLTMVGPVGTRGFLRALAEAHGGFVLDPGFPLEVVEMEPGASWAPAGEAFRIFCFSTPHTEESLALRLEAEDGILGYTGDTGFDPELGVFLAGSSVLLAECSHPDGADAANHLTPTTLAEMASRAGPGLLVPVHVYPPLRPEDLPDLLRAAGYSGEVRAAYDGMECEVAAGEVRELGGPEGKV